MKSIALLFSLCAILPYSAYGRTSISGSGTAASPLVYDGVGASTQGFDVTGSYIVIKRWNIFTQANGTAGYGVYLHGGANHVTIQNNYIHNLCADAVYMNASVSYITVTANYIDKAAMSGIHLDGHNDIASYNQIYETWQYPDRFGGIYSNCQERNGADADGIRFFGSNHIISNNVIRDIPYGGWGSTASPNPHTDCFQTWGESGESTDNILIDYNDCRSNSATNNKNVEIAMLQGFAGPVGTITFKYNTFADMRQGINIFDSVGAVVFDHNSSAHILQENLIYRQTITSASSITNNIFYDCGNGADSYTTSLSPTISNNDCIMANGSRCGSYPVPAPGVSLNPEFVSLGSGTDPWPNMDFHLQPTTPVPSMGAFPLE